MQRMSTKFGVDSPSSFSFQAQTHRHSHRCHWSQYLCISYCQPAIRQVFLPTK